MARRCLLSHRQLFREHFTCNEEKGNLPKIHKDILTGVFTTTVHIIRELQYEYNCISRERIIIGRERELEVGELLTKVPIVACGGEGEGEGRGVQTQTFAGVDLIPLLFSHHHRESFHF